MTGSNWNYNEWPEADTERVRVLWAKGMSAGVIGIEVGRTRNAIIGKVARMKWPKRQSHVTLPNRNHGSGQKWPPPKKPGHRQTNYNFSIGRPRAPRPPAVRSRRPPPKLEDIVPVNHGAGISLFDLHSRVCHAVISDMDHRSVNELARYCGHRIYHGRYCEGHYVAFHLPPRERR